MRIHFTLLRSIYFFIILISNVSDAKTKLPNPQVNWLPSAAVPIIRLQYKWTTNDPVWFVKWLADGLSLLTVSDNQLTIRSQQGILESVEDFSNSYGYKHLLMPSYIVSVDDVSSSFAFTIYDKELKQILLQEPAPKQSAPGQAQSAVHFAVSQDNSTLAVAYTNALSGQPITIYDVKNWRKISTIINPIKKVSGVGQIVLSKDGSVLAFVGNDQVIICNVHTGQIIQKISGRFGIISLSSDGDRIAVERYDFPSSAISPKSMGIFIYRVLDGVQLSLHRPLYANKNCLDNPEDCTIVTPIIWDERSRFLIYREGRNTIRIWNPVVDTGDDVTIQIGPLFGGIALSPDGSRLVVTEHDSISLFQIGGSF